MKLLSLGTDDVDEGRRIQLRRGDDGKRCLELDNVSVRGWWRTNCSLDEAAQTYASRTTNQFREDPRKRQKGRMVSGLLGVILLL